MGSRALRYFKYNNVAYTCLNVKDTLHLWRERNHFIYKPKLDMLMKKTFLLPHSFKKVGWAILIPTFIIGLLMFIDGCNGFPSYLLTGVPKSSRLYEILDSTVMGHVLNNIAIIGICMGSLFVACSREPIEDELITQVRLNSLLIALYLNTVFIVVSALCFYELDYLYVMIGNIFAVLLVFLVVYEVKLWRLKKSMDYEE